MTPTMVSDVPAASLRAVDLVTWTTPRPSVPAGPRVETRAPVTRPTIPAGPVFAGIQRFFVEDEMKARTGESVDLTRLAEVIEQAVVTIEDSDDLLCHACEAASTGADPVALHRSRTLIFALAMGRQLELAPDRLRTLGLVAARIDGGAPAAAPLGTGQPDDATIRTTAETYARQLGTGVNGRGATAYAALHMMVRGRQGHPVTLRALLGALGCFPPGTMLRLSSGEIARVIGANRRQPLRPMIDILITPKGERLRAPKRVDLTEAPFLHIVGPVELRPLDGRPARA